MQGREFMENYVGIDISKRYFDIHCLPEQNNFDLKTIAAVSANA